MKVLMPQIGMTMIEGIIEKWHVRDGEKVQKGDVIAEISTEKVVNEIKAPATGTIKLMAKEGDTIPCAEQIAEIIE